MILTTGVYCFDHFRLDLEGRQLWNGTKPVEINGRSLDALALLVAEAGQLVRKERFFDEVWTGVIVSDSALTQCIKTIRKELGDDAINPRYVQTVPRYGYRFVGQVERMEAAAPAPVVAVPAGGKEASAEHGTTDTPALHRAVTEGLAGTLGGGVAGLVGGFIYGLATAQGPGSGMGTISTLVVFISLGVFIGLAAGLGVSGGMAAGSWYGQGRMGWPLLGAMVGGMLVGGVAQLVGLDAFSLLFGLRPRAITGPLEGAAVGAALALGAQLAGGFGAKPWWRPVAGSAVAAAVVGVLIPLLGGHLFAGSLQGLVQTFSRSQLRMAALGNLFGDGQLAPVTQALLGGIELLIFASCVVGGIALAKQRQTVKGH